ncbi:hypothetical protein DB30_07607 [Enhygromyxa salina]|uniref:Uncharacterized protein n=1 Tax=Enhygromyxa salina TaxID=215803 RepID=A0A0C2CRG6_9BACT|nr:hypothetical protein [Enhygromyxa salina]KIG13761.1 hypothetical protein DB30_07607 [Enhygromyxa salina]
MAKTTGKPSGKSSSGSGDASDASGKSSSKLGWLLGWVLVPGMLVGALFLAGLHVGARHPQMGLSRAVLWVMGSEAQLGPANEAERQPLARRMRLTALPSKSQTLESDLSKADLDALVAAGAGKSIAALDCAAVCKIQWTAKHADKEFISVQSCELTQPTLFTPAKLECDAKVQR